MNNLIERLEGQAKILTKSLAPQHPFSYSEVYQIVLPYLIECYVSDIEYSEKELENRIFTQYVFR